MTDRLIKTREKLKLLLRMFGSNSILVDGKGGKRAIRSALGFVRGYMEKYDIDFPFAEVKGVIPVPFLGEPDKDKLSVVFHLTLSDYVLAWTEELPLKEEDRERRINQQNALVKSRCAWLEKNLPHYTAEELACLDLKPVEAKEGPQEDVVTAKWTKAEMRDALLQMRERDAQNWLDGRGYHTISSKREIWKITWDLALRQQEMTSQLIEVMKQRCTAADLSVLVENSSRLYNDLLRRRKCSQDVISKSQLDALKVQNQQLREEYSTLSGTLQLAREENRDLKKKIKYLEEQIKNTRRRPVPLEFSKEKRPKSLCVTFPNGYFLQHKLSQETFAETIKMIGVDRVLQLDLTCDDFPLIDTKLKSSIKQLCIAPGRYLFIKSSTKVKADLLRRIISAFRLGWTVEP